MTYMGLQDMEKETLFDLLGGAFLDFSKYTFEYRTYFLFQMEFVLILTVAFSY